MANNPSIPGGDGDGDDDHGRDHDHHGKDHDHDGKDHDGKGRGGDDGRGGRDHGGDDKVAVFGKDHGNDTVSNYMGSRSDTISFLGSAARNDTISLGLGSDTIFESGHATVQGLFGQATLSGGQLQVFHSGWDEIAVSGKATLLGGSLATEFVGGTGSTSMRGGSGADTFVGGSGFDTMTGGGIHSQNVFAFLGAEKGGQHVITNFVSGQDKLYLEGYSLSYLKQHSEITQNGGNTYISLDHGATTIELKGVTNLHASDITTHKPS